MSSGVTDGGGRGDDMARPPNDATFRHDLCAALARPGCALCRLIDRATRRHIFALYYDLVMESEVRDEVRQSRGLCHDHLWDAVQMEQQRHGDGGGLALILEDGLGLIQAQVDRAHANADDGWGAQALRRVTHHGAGSAIDAALRPARTCPACETSVEATTLFTDVLARHVTDRDVAEALDASFGLCLRHWGRVIDAAPDQARRDALRRVQQVKVAALLHDLHAMARGAGVDTTDDTWIRATEALVGRRSHPDEGGADVIAEWQRAWSDEIARFKRYKGVLWQKEGEGAPR